MPQLSITLLLRSRAVWIACVASWLALAIFVLTRDLVMIGSDAPGLGPERLMPFLESMVLRGVLSPFIIALCVQLPLNRSGRIRSLALHVVWALLFCAIDVAVDALFGLIDRTFPKPLLQHFYDEVFINTFSYAAVAAAGYAFIYSRELALSRVHATELERLLAEARLAALTRRLQPHFLFNSLNSIAALIRLEDSSKALVAVVALSDLLRVVLATNGDAYIPLQKELAWAERYLQIERLRFESRLDTQINVDSPMEQALVPALILQPFVENAIRHGVEHDSGRSVVSIAARRHGEFLAMIVRNEGGSRSKRKEYVGFGLGVESTRERLVHLYGDDRFVLDIEELNDGAMVTIRIPYMEVAA